MYGGGRLRRGLIRTPFPLFGPEFFLIEGFWVDKFAKYEFEKEDEDDDEDDLLLLEIDGCFCKFGLWESFEFDWCFGFKAEPVELLLDRKCKDRIKLLLLELSQFRLLLRLNCQKDFDCGFSSASKLADRSSLRLFFSEETEFLEGSGGIGGIRRGDLLGLRISLFGSIDLGRILPLEKSSSAEERSCKRRLPMQKSKSDSRRLKSNRSRSQFEEGNKSVWFRSCENEILGLIPTVEISEQTSIAISITAFVKFKPGKSKGWGKGICELNLGNKWIRNCSFSSDFSDEEHRHFEEIVESKLKKNNKNLRITRKESEEREWKVLKLSTERLQKEES